MDKFTDDDLQQIEGNYETFVGKGQERYGDQKDKLMKWADQWLQKSPPDDIKTRMLGRVWGKDGLKIGTMTSQ